jgi:hypothetical protein
MPNLIPDWDMGWLFGDSHHLTEAGRLIWSILATGVGLTFLMALMRPPLLKRPFPTRVGIALFPAIIVGGLVLAKLVPSVQRTIIWLMLAALVGHALLMVLSRNPRPADQEATWAECFAGAVAAFVLMTIVYAIVPHEWLTFANSTLGWGDSSKFVFQSNEKMLFLPWNWPFSMDFPAVRDIVVSGIYVVFLGANVKFWVMWQKRHEVAAAAAASDDDATPARRSRFGRPLRAWSARRAETPSTTAPAPSGSGGV